jgi:hypothetical protein
MRPEDRARALDPFFSGREAGRHRGLGLPRAFRAIQANGGQMTLDSKTGQGTTVRVTFRAAPVADAGPAPPGRSGTGFQPVNHGQDAHATSGSGTGFQPVNHGQDAHATSGSGTGFQPVNHGQDAHATSGSGTGFQPVNHGQVAPGDSPRRDAHAASRASPGQSPAAPDATPDSDEGQRPSADASDDEGR